MTLKIFLYIFILLVATISIYSYKKGVYAVWLAIMLLPPIIHMTPIVSILNFNSILMLCPILSEWRSNKNRIAYQNLLFHNYFFLLYIFIVGIIVLLSHTVPLRAQIEIYISEIITMLFVIQNYILFKSNPSSCKFMLGFISIILLFNIVYSIFFEIILRFNPAGNYLYILLGKGDSEFLVDMNEYARGTFAYRIQTVYGHPNSLGQYLVVLLPLFFVKMKINFRWLYIIGACFLILLTGSRSAIVPMTIVLLLSFGSSIKEHLVQLLFVSLTIIVVLMFVPDRTMYSIEKNVEPFVAGLSFWDDNEQSKKGISGSSMDMRQTQWKASNKEIRNNPLFGQGLGYRDYWQLKHGGLHPELFGYESVIFYYLVERGWIGLVSFFIFLFYLYRLFTSNSNDNNTIRLIFLSYIISLIMIGVRPYSFILVCLASSLICGLFPSQKVSNRI